MSPYSYGRSSFDTLNRPRRSNFFEAYLRFRRAWVDPLFFGLLVAIVVRTFIVQPYSIPSSSMEDTLLVGDHILALKFAYGIPLPFAGRYLLRFHDPAPGDVVVFRFPVDPRQDFIKRCVAVAGQRVSIRDKQLFVDDVPVPLPPHGKHIDEVILPFAANSPRDNIREFVVPEGMFFALGDNRDESNDSRYWGFVPYDNIRGKARWVYWSWVRGKNGIERIRWERILESIH